MKHRGPIFLSLAAILAIGLAFYRPVSNEQKEALLMQSLLTDLQYYHYQPAALDDEFSNKVYDLFLKRLDGNKRWLTQADLALLQPYRNQLDDDIKAANYAFLDLAIRLQEQGIQKTQAYYREFLAKPFDYSVEEYYETDGDKKAFAADDDQLREYWRLAMKFETMTRLVEKLDKKEEGHPDFKDKSFEDLEAEARSELLKVYDDWYKRLGKRKREDHVSMYLNCITNVFDPHTEYYQPIDKQNFDIGMSGRLEGIGARLQSDGDYTKVAEIIVGGPAWKGGELEANDRILKVAQGDDPEWTDITGMLLNDVVQLIRGKPGTKVRLYVKKVDGSTKEISIIRDVVILEEGFAKSLIIETPGQEKIGFINLPKFYADFNHEDGRRCAKDVAIEIEKLKKEGVDGIILDLRNNGGGSLRDVVQMSGFFFEEGPVVQVKARERRPQVLDDEDPSVLYNGPLIVMVNQFSASASEILAAALQDYGRAVIVGVGPSTFGKGTVQRFFDLDNIVRGNPEVKPLGEVKITVQKFFRVNGGATQLKGVIPDIVLPSVWQEIPTGEKEEEYPMPWTQIDPVPYGQRVFSVTDILPQLKERSIMRVRQDSVFQRVVERAQAIKAQRDNSQYPLQLEAYRMQDKALQAQNKAFDQLFEREVITQVRNLTADLEAINSDESRKARNDEWLKNIRKDVYLLETLHIMDDLLAVK